MATLALPAAYALLLWFVSTGAIIWLVGRSRRVQLWSLGGAGIIACVAVYGIIASRADIDALGAYCAFTCALGVWGWHEMSFLMGVVTGPRRTPCPPGVAGWERFKLSAATLIHHEVALALTLAAIAMLTWGQSNQTATLTFALLFAMRLSTKLNIFAGVPNLTEDFLPAGLDYLKSYFRKRPAQPIFAVSLSAAIAVTAWLAARAFDDAATGVDATGIVLLFTLAALGILEHVFMVLPLPDAALWRWAISTKPAISPATRPTK